MASATAGLSSSAGLPPNSYIYKIISTAARQDPLTYSKLDSLTIISSDDSLRFLDPSTLNVLPNGIIQNVNEKVTCLERANDAPSNIVATAGRDGRIRFWDKRTQQKALEIDSRKLLHETLTLEMSANVSYSTQAHLVIGMRCNKKLYSCGHRKSRRRTRYFSRLYLVGNNIYTGTD